MPDNASPLANGWFAVYLDDGIWEIFDEDGVPLGLILFDSDGDIEDYDVEGNLIPLVQIFFPDGRVVIELAKPNPPTGDNLWVIWLFPLLAFAAAIVFKKKYVR